MVFEIPEYAIFDKKRCSSFEIHFCKSWSVRVEDPIEVSLYGCILVHCNLGLACYAVVEER